MALQSLHYYRTGNALKCCCSALTGKSYTQVNKSATCKDQPRIKLGQLFTSVLSFVCFNSLTEKDALVTSLQDELRVAKEKVATHAVSLFTCWWLISGNQFAASHLTDYVVHCLNRTLRQNWQLFKMKPKKLSRHFSHRYL